MVMAALTLDDYDFWITDVLGGAAGVDCTAILVDHLQTSYVVVAPCSAPPTATSPADCTRDVELQIDQVEIDTTTGEAGYWPSAGRRPPTPGD